MDASIGDIAGSIGIALPEIIHKERIAVSLPEGRRSSGSAPGGKSRRIVNFSEKTATYDGRATFPALKLFQVTKHVPEYKPFGNLLEPNPENAGALLLGSYSRTLADSGSFVQVNALA